MRLLIYAFMAYFSTTLNAYASYHPGDIILLPIECYACKAIEKETGSPYAHSGLVIEDQGELVVLEAWSKVEKTSLSDFMDRAKFGVSPLLIRSKELERRFPDPEDLDTLNQILLSSFNDNFEGLKYDDEYLWNNKDENGQELLYCSEMITKLLNGILKNKMPTYTMTYTKARDFWVKYFKGPPPAGKPGNNPGSFLRSELFFIVEP